MTPNSIGYQVSVVAGLGNDMTVGGVVEAIPTAFGLSRPEVVGLGVLAVLVVVLLASTDVVDERDAAARAGSGAKRGAVAAARATPRRLALLFVAALVVGFGVGYRALPALGVNLL